MEDLKVEITSLREDVKLLTEQVQKLTQSCSRMDNHITFVEQIYKTVRKPADYMLAYWNKWTQPHHSDKLELELPVLLT